MDPVAEQASAYNAHDVDRFLSCYTTDAVIEELDGSAVMRGSEEMRRQYSQLFREHPAITATIGTQIRSGDYTVYEEIITGVQPERRGVAIYHRAGELIDRVVFLGW
jgi:hypothetical protein